MPWWESEQQVKEKKAKEQAKKARRWGDPDKGYGRQGQDYFQRQAEANRRERERREAAEAAAQRRAEQDYWEGEKARNDAQRQRQQEAAAAAAEMQKFQTAAEVRAVRPPTTQQTPGGRPMGGPQGRPSETEEDEQEFQAPVWIAEQQQIGSAYTAPPVDVIIPLPPGGDLAAAQSTMESVVDALKFTAAALLPNLLQDALGLEDPKTLDEWVSVAETLDPIGTGFEYGTRAALDEYGLTGGAYEYLPLMVGLIGSVGTAAFTGTTAGTGGAAVKGGKLAALVGRNADDIVAILAREISNPDFVRDFIIKNADVPTHATAEQIEAGLRVGKKAYVELADVIGRRLKGTIFGQPGHLVSATDNKILKAAAGTTDELTQAGYRSVTAGGDVAIGLGEGAARTGAPPGTAAAAADIAAEAGGVAGKFAGPEWAGSITVTGRAVKNIAGAGPGRILAQDPNFQRLLDDGAGIILDRNWQAAADDLALRLEKQAGMTADEAMAAVKRIAFAAGISGGRVGGQVAVVQSADDFVAFAGRVLDEAGVVLPVGRYGGAGLGAAVDEGVEIVGDVAKKADDYFAKSGGRYHHPDHRTALDANGRPFAPDPLDGPADPLKKTIEQLMDADINLMPEDALKQAKGILFEDSLGGLSQAQRAGLVGAGVLGTGGAAVALAPAAATLGEKIQEWGMGLFPPTDTDRLGEAGMPGALAQQAIAEGLPASVVEERERVVAREHADDELTALLESFELAEGQLSSTEPTIRKETDDGLSYTVNGLETGEVVAVVGPDGVTYYRTPEDAAEYEGNEARLDAEEEAITVGEGEEWSDAEARDTLRYKGWGGGLTLGVGEEPERLDAPMEEPPVPPGLPEHRPPQTGMTGAPVEPIIDPETGEQIWETVLEQDGVERSVPLHLINQWREELGIHSDVWLDPGLKSDQEVLDEYYRLKEADPRFGVGDAEEVGGDEGGDEVLVDGGEEGEPGTDNPFGELVAIPDQTHDPDLLEGQWDELQNMAFIVREAAGLTREGAMERHGWGEDVFDMAEQYVKWYAADYGQTPEEFLRAQQAAGWAYHHGGGAPPGPPSDTYVSDEDREESSGGLPGDGGDNNPGYSFNESGNAAGPVSQYAMYGEGLQNSDVTYGITNQPSWWQSYVPAKQGPLADYLGVLNAVMPYLASQDAMAVGSNLYRNAPKEFSAYSAANLNLPVTLDLDIGLFMNKTWVENMVTAMDSLQEAQGYDAGPGYTWMHDFLNTIMHYLPVEGSRQLLGDWEAMLAAIEPMLTEASSQTETAAYVSLARMVYYPTSIGNKGRMVPVYGRPSDPGLM